MKPLPPSPRGLTMLEVLAATVILSMIAVACLPMLTQALASLRPPNEKVGVASDLSQLADQFMDKPDAFGFKDAREIIQQRQFRIAWPEEFNARDRQAVSVRCLVSSLEEIEHGWLVFECSDTTVSRRIELPKPAKDNAVRSVKR